MPVLALHDHDQAAFAFRPASNEDDPVETPLRSRAGQEAASGGCRFSAWRGRSGRRYVVSTFAIGDDAALTYAEAVILAVSADRRVLDVKDSGPWSVAEALARWRDEMVALGARELHVHLIAATSSDRLRAIGDLMPLV